MGAYDRSKGLVKGLFWGGLIGVVIGTLYTTKKNKGTWENLGKSVDNFFDKTKGQVKEEKKE